jgi:hypothetical protein
MTDQKPSVGRIVHYASHGTPLRADGSQAFTSQCRAAIVTEVELGISKMLGGDRVGLCVLNPTGLFLHSLDAGGCKQNEDEHVGGTWHWPERV